MEQPDGKQTNQNCSIISRITDQLEGSKKNWIQACPLWKNPNILLSQDHFLLVSGNLEDDLLGPKRALNFEFSQQDNPRVLDYRGGGGV